MGNLLHGLEDNRIVAHTEVIISAPNLDLIFDVAGVGNGELGGKAVDIIEVAVGLVLMLLLELIDIEVLIIKPGVCIGLLSLDRSRGLVGLCGSGSLVEGAAGSCSLGGNILGLGGVDFVFGSGSEIVCFACSGFSSGGVGTHLGGCTRGRENALFLVNLLYVYVCSDASVAGNDLV